MNSGHAPTHYTLVASGWAKMSICICTHSFFFPSCYDGGRGSPFYGQSSAWGLDPTHSCLLRNITISLFNIFNFSVSIEAFLSVNKYAVVSYILKKITLLSHKQTSKSIHTIHNSVWLSFQISNLCLDHGIQKEKKGLSLFIGRTRTHMKQKRKIQDCIW